MLLTNSEKELFMRCISVVSFLLSVFLFCPFPLAGKGYASPRQEESRLVKVVVLGRHGVRSPIQTPETLAMWSSRTWPSWGTAPGQLTERGASLIRSAWASMRSELAFDGLLPSSECPESDAVFLYADNEERTVATARNILQGLAPGCSFNISTGTEKVDPLFHPVQNGFMTSPRFSDRDKQTLAGRLIRVHAEQERNIAELSAILGTASSRLCSPGRSFCSLGDIPSTLLFPPSESQKNVSLKGGLSIASSTAEILLLESLEWPEQALAIPVEQPAPVPRRPAGPVEMKTRQIITAPKSDTAGAVPLRLPSRWEPALPESSAAPVMANPGTAFRLLAVHTAIQNVIQRYPAVARSNGLPLLSLIAETLNGTSPIDAANKARLVIFSGHDTNLINIAGMLGLHWDNAPLPPDSTPPGSMLIFRLWETPQGVLVQVAFQSQTPAAFLNTDEPAMREAALHHVPLLLPGKLSETPSGPGLPLTTFRNTVHAMTGNNIPAMLKKYFTDKINFD